MWLRDGLVAWGDDEGEGDGLAEFDASGGAGGD